MRLTEGQRAILDDIDEHGEIRVFTDWRSGRRHVTNGRGRSFNVRSFDSLVQRGLIGEDTENPQYGHRGIRYVRRDA